MDRIVLRSRHRKYLKKRKETCPIGCYSIVLLFFCVNNDDECRTIFIHFRRTPSGSNSCVQVYF